MTGRLVPVRSADALADALAGLVGDAATRAAMGAAAAERAAAEFDQRRVIATTLATYERLLRVAGAPVPS